MCIIILNNEVIKINGHEDVQKIIGAFNKPCNFIIEKTEHVYISVCLKKNYVAAIYHNYSSENPIMLNASLTPSMSDDRILFDLNQQITPIPKNMCLSRKLGIQVITDFCFGKEMSSSVYWLADVHLC